MCSMLLLLLYKCHPEYFLSLSACVVNYTGTYMEPPPAVHVRIVSEFASFITSAIISVTAYSTFHVETKKRTYSQHSSGLFEKLSGQFCCFNNKTEICKHVVITSQCCYGVFRYALNGITAFLASTLIPACQ